MQVLVFQTNIESPKDIEQIAHTLTLEPSIQHWTVDTEDKDCVLRVVASGVLTEESIIEAVREAGFFCTTLL